MLTPALQSAHLVMFKISIHLHWSGDEKLNRHHNGRELNFLPKWSNLNFQLTLLQNPQILSPSLLGIMQKQCSNISYYLHSSYTYIYIYIYIYEYIYISIYRYILHGSVCDPGFHECIKHETQGYRHHHVIYIYIYIYISSTSSSGYTASLLPCNFSLSSITSAKSSRVHPVSIQSCCM